MYELFDGDSRQTVAVMEPEKADTSNVDCIVLLVDDLKTESGIQFGSVSGSFAYNQEMCGAVMWEWVARACPSQPIRAKMEGDADLLRVIKPLLKEAEYTLVLYSDTPLVTADAVNQILEYAITRNLAVCKLARGWVFKTDYLKRAEAVYATTTYDVGASALTQVNTLKGLEQAKKTLAKRIMDYHIGRGVQIISPEHTYIDCNVTISAGAIIEPFVTLAGKTNIGASKICSYSKLQDSKVGDKTIIKSNTILEGAIIGDNCMIGNKVTIVGQSVIGNDSTMAMNSHLANVLAADECVFGTSCSVINTKLAAKVTIQEGAQCIGSIGSEIKIGSGATVGIGCKIIPGVYIKAGTIAPAGKIVRPQEDKQ